MPTTEDDLFWITGAYKAIKPDQDGAEEGWVSFSYGPFFTQDEADKRAMDEDAMMAALGKDLAESYDIDCTERLSFGGACKHFWETLQSEHFKKWYEEERAG